MRSELIKLFGEDFVARFNAFAQVAAICVGGVCFYELRVFKLIAATIRGLDRMKNYITVGPLYTHVSFDEQGRKIVRGELSRRGYFLMSGLIFAYVLWSQHGPFFFITYVWRQLCSALTVWSELQFSWISLIVLFKSLLYLIWAWGVFFLLIMVITIFLKTSGFVSGWVQRRLTEASFHFVLFIVFVFSGLMILATSLG